MSSFDPDAYLAEKEAFDPDAYLASKTRKPAEPSMLESALGGALSGASLNFRDELSGAIEALGSTVGLRGLGGPLAGIRLETPEEDKLSFADVYKQGTEAKRQLMERESEANPKAYLAGELAGGLALPVSGAKSALDIAKNTAKLGAIAGFGAGEGAVGSTVSAGIGGALGYGGSLAASKATQKVPKVLDYLATKYTGKDKPSRDTLARVANKLIGGVKEEQTQRYIDRNKEIRELLASGKKTSELGKELSSQLNEARNAISKASTESYDILAKNQTSVPAKDVVAILESRLSKLKSYGFKDADLRSDIKYINDLKKQIKELSTVPKPAAPEKPLPGIGLAPETPKYDPLDFDLPGENVKEMLQLLDTRLEKAYVENAASKRSPGARALKGIRTETSERMKELDPEFAEKMQDIANQTRIVKEAAQSFAKPKQAMQALNRIGRERDPFAEEALTAFDELKGTGFADTAKDIVTGQILKGQSTQGSRNVNLGRGLFSKIPVFGEALGAVTGYAADKYGRPAVTKAIDWSLISRRLPDKYRRALSYGAEKGTNAAAVNHFLMYNQDPQYRQEFEKAQQDVDNGM